MNTSHTLLPLSSEFTKADLGDARRSARLERIADQAASAPEASLPGRAGDPSQLEGTYRFLNNSHVEPEAVLEPHQQCVVGRAEAAGSVLVLHDTTDFGFGGEARQGLGTVAGSSKSGFYAHFSFCVGLDGRPLGTLGLHAWMRQGEPKGKRSQQQSNYDPDRESLRWPEAVHRCEELLHGRARAIHIMDREGDCFEWLADMAEHGHQFVVRAMHDRRLDADRKVKNVTKLYETLGLAPVLVEREVPLSPRKQVAGRPPNKERFPDRKMRIARLAMRATTLEISPGNGSALHLPARLKLNFVEVTELGAPEGEAPILWRLVTTEAIETAEQIASVVDMYRRRWQIEEFFKAIKTGCRYEDLQVESGRALLVALPIFAAVAWRMLLMRWLDRYQPTAPAAQVLNKSQLAVLTAVRQRERKPLPAAPTVHDALTAIARMGGHLPQNGPPGWLVLGRGMRKLLEMEIGWLVATGEGAQ
jgi:hypothetical protein